MPDRIRTLVSMATESCHRVIMEKTVSLLFLGCLSSDPFHACMRARTSSNFGLLGPLAAELAALEYLKNDVSTFYRLLLIGSFSYLQVMITYMRAWMSLKFDQIQPLVSMVTDMVMMGKTVSPLFLGCFSSDPFHTCRQ